MKARRTRISLAIHGALVLAMLPVAASAQTASSSQPTALDTVVQHQMVELLDGLVRERGLTLLFVTHDIALASQLGDEVAVLFDGRLMEAGPLRQVLRAPRHAYTRALLASRLDLDTPLRRRLPEIGADFLISVPDG